MKLTKIVLLVSTLGLGVSHAAGTAPCNGFKINLSNYTHQKIVVDNVLFTKGTLTSLSSQPIDLNDTALYTVNGTVENDVMQGQFLVHTIDQPFKELRINFNLTNKDVYCEVSNTAQEGSMHTSFDRVLGGLSLPVKE